MCVPRGVVQGARAVSLSIPDRVRTTCRNRICTRYLPYVHLLPSEVKKRHGEEENLM